MTDKTLKFEMMRNSFRKKVNAISQDFVIVLGYTYVNAEIIRRLHDANIEAVLIDENEDKISHFLLEDMSYDVPVMIDNVLLGRDLGICRN